MIRPVGWLGMTWEESKAEPQRYIGEGRRDVHSQDQCRIRWDETGEATVVPEKCSSVNGLNSRGVLESRRPSMLCRKEKYRLKGGLPVAVGIVTVGLGEISRVQAGKKRFEDAACRV